MINIILPSSEVKQFPKGTTGSEIAKSISISLSKIAIAIEINSKICDIRSAVNEDAKIRIITTNDPEAEEIVRHDAAHILAQATKHLFPNVQVTIGPAIENGFYYDFATEKPFTENDLALIEEQMHKIVKENHQFERIIWDRKSAIEYFKSIGEHYKVQIIESIPEGEDLSVYKQGDFIDLCRGPHGLSTGYVKHFKLMKVAGAYWRGDSNNQMLQRIYGTAWLTEEKLDNYLYMLEEAAKRDHRKIGKELGLFHFQEEAQGMVFWHEKGYTLWRIIENYIRNKLEQNGYFEVKTPLLLDRKLWEASGHWEKFRENMFISEVDKEVLALKPMSCPCHVQIFKQGIKSYKDLPIRMAEFGSCHRYESSGSLHGTMRVRNFTQDDAHIFCTEEQITDETIKFCNSLIEVYKDFGFEEISVKFSDRPSVRAGSDATWDKAENALKEAVNKAGLKYTLNPGEGAFYGPKLEFVLKDAVGRDWQLGTLQVDFVLPERLDANYISAQGAKTRPVMLHRAIIGTFERFIGVLIEHYSGRLPLWLAPIQVSVATITNEVDDYGNLVYDSLKKSGIRCTIDTSAEKINYKIRNLFNQKIPIIAIIGKEERKENMVSIRLLGANDQINNKMSVEDLIKFIGNNKTNMINQ
jgi:threonyl-tRNA synthetase